MQLMDICLMMKKLIEAQRHIIIGQRKGVIL
jgi:hypothetical protein